MLQLEHLHAPTFFVDATQHALEVAKKIQRFLGSKVFRVMSTTMEGMDHLLPGKLQLNREEAEKLAKKLHLDTYTLDTAGIARLSRVAAVLQENPAVVNPKLAPNDAKLYYQIVHDHVEVFALDLQDLEKPADTPPF
jgi:hypothetical protein